MTSHSCLFILIGKTYYGLYRTTPEDSQIITAWRLIKSNGKIYDVHLDKHGLHCDCPDFICRKQNTPELCKHAQALMDHGLIQGATL